MINTYSNTAEADADRARPKELVAALNVWDRALRRDECGAWRINGQRGHVYTFGDGWVLCVECATRRHWTFAKQRLDFCGVYQDGDEEGCLLLSRLPTPEQAAVIRSVLRIRKRAELSAEHLERFVSAGKKSRFRQDDNATAHGEKSVASASKIAAGTLADTSIPRRSPTAINWAATPARPISATR